LAARAAGELTAAARYSANDGLKDTLDVSLFDGFASKSQTRAELKRTLTRVYNATQKKRRSSPTVTPGGGYKPSHRRVSSAAETLSSPTPTQARRALDSAFFHVYFDFSVDRGTSAKALGREAKVRRGVGGGAGTDGVCGEQVQASLDIIPGTIAVVSAAVPGRAKVLHEVREPRGRS
jgi:hypothetical protein